MLHGGTQINFEQPHFKGVINYYIKTIKTTRVFSPINFFPSR
jgi:hypothetical protein